MLTQSDRRSISFLIICKYDLRLILMKIFCVLVLIVVFLIPFTNSDTFKCVKDGFYPDKKDCWIYHICDGASHSVKACKEDLLFNPIKNECDWAMNVNPSINTHFHIHPHPFL